MIGCTQLIEKKTRKEVELYTRKIFDEVIDNETKITYIPGPRKLCWDNKLPDLIENDSIKNYSYFSTEKKTEGEVDIMKEIYIQHLLDM